MSSLPITEVLKKVQRLQIRANRTVNDLFAGQYRSVFRGRGMEFEEVRQYQPGDDIRSIDWNVTARSGDCFVKRFCEERELTVLFLVDFSASGWFGSTTRSKLDVMVELVAVLMFSALKNQDRVGLLTFGDEVIDFFRPRKSKAQVLRLVRHLVDFEPVKGTTRMEPALDFINRVQKRRAVVFLISDFLCPLPTQLLTVTHRRHDLTAITVRDRREATLPNSGFIRLQDAETGRTQVVDTSHRQVRERFALAAAQRQQQLTQDLRRLGIDQLDIDTSEDYLIAVQRFFRKREARARS